MLSALVLIELSRAIRCWKCDPPSTSSACPILPLAILVNVRYRYFIIRGIAILRYIEYPGLCSNAFEAVSLAFDCPVMDAFALAFDSFAFALAFDSNAFD